MATSDEGPSVAFVVPRYGPDVLGGAETHCRILAENLAAHGTRTTVLTTCATNHFTWANDLPEGAAVENGVTVRRFPVGPRDPNAFGGFHTSIALGGQLSYWEQLSWMGNSVWSPGMLEAVADERSYDWIVPIPYLFGTTFWATTVRPDRTAVIPCIHDEPHARTDVVLDCLSSARGLLPNTATERALIRQMLESHRDGDTRAADEAPLVAVGYEDAPPPTDARVEDFCRRHGVEPGFLLYAGRRELGKGVGELFALYRAYRSAARNPRALALIGSGHLATPEDLIPHVIDLGFLPDEDMPAAFAAAGVLINPSRLESLGMILLEAWMAGTPALVNGRSPVLVEHCREGGGLWWGSEADFIEAVELITSSPEVSSRLAEAGRTYVMERFTWPEVRRRFLGALEAWT